jgi:predicted MFS family arabinose efflux permease
MRYLVTAAISFLPLVDLFATQAILPSLTVHYGVSPAAMGFAVNASTIGMAVAGILVALFARHIDRRRGVAASLALLAIPTLALSVAPDLTTFTLLRVVQGLAMSTAFTLTMAYLAETSSAEETAGLFAAYITGNVASNLIGRLISAAVADQLGLASNFTLFAGLNLAGAVIAWYGLTKCGEMGMAAPGGRLAVWLDHIRNPALAASFAIGFLILFAFIGTFTYVNFVLVGEAIGLSMMSLGLVYFVYLPSMLTTPLAGYVARRAGTRPTFVAALAVAVAGLPLLVVPNLASVLAGLMLVAVGTFFAQAAATGFVGRAAASDRGSACGIYLASYYTGGVVGAAVLGLVFDRLGWEATVLGFALALALAAVLSAAHRLPRPAPR